MGLGGGTILMIYFLIVGQVQKNAQGINLLFIIPISLIATVINYKNNLINKKILPMLIFGGIIGLSVGILALKYIDNKILKTFFSVFLIFLGIREIVMLILEKKKNKKD